MDDRERIKEKLFGDSNNFKKSKWRPVRDFISKYFDEIELYMKQGGKLSHLTEVIREETGLDVPEEVVMTIKSRIKRSGKRPSVTPPAPQKAPEKAGEKKRWSDLQLRTSKDFVDVDIRDL
jgi:hypothetical protein